MKHIKLFEQFIKENDNLEMLKLMNKAMRIMPGSKKQKEIIKQLNVLRIANGLEPLKESSIIEYVSNLDNSYILNKDAQIEEASKEDIIKDLDKAKNDLLKKVDVLIAKKKKLYSNVDIESPMSSDEKKLDKDIADLFSQINKLVLQKRNLKEDLSFN